ncbi:MAG: dehydrogenase (quinone) [Firmicutes bacterium]|nr:dehydrogenase (quinone) [Bacillota bacterium]
MYESNLLLWLFLIPAAAALLEAMSGRYRAKQAGIISIIGAILTLLVALSMCREVLAGNTLTAWNDQLYADALSSLMALIVTIVGLAVLVFSYRYMRHDVEAGKTTTERLPLYFALISIFISTMAWGTVTNNLVMLYVIIEATTLASALLVTFYWKPESLEAGYKYLILCSVGITLALLGTVLLYAAAVPFLPGDKALLITELVKISGHIPSNIVFIACGLILIGFGTKAGIIPFHAWLPDAHSQSPSPVSALLSGVTIKVAIYAVARILTIFYPQYSALATFLVLVGAVTMLLGIILAFIQDDLKRMLAYSSVSQMGYIVMGFGIGGYVGFYGSVYHMLNHALLKSLLFLCTGALLYTSGTTLISELQGKKQGTLTAICFFVAALAVGGLPPLNGFWSKFTIFVAAAQAQNWWAVGIAVFTSLLTLACLVRAGYRIFLYQDDHHGGEAAIALEEPGNAGHEGHIGIPSLPLSMSMVMVILVALSVLLGAYPSIIYPLLDLASKSLLHLAIGG